MYKALTSDIRGGEGVHGARCVHITAQLSRKTLHGLRLSSVSANWLSLVYRRIYDGNDVSAG